MQHIAVKTLDAKILLFESRIEIRIIMLTLPAERLFRALTRPIENGLGQIVHQKCRTREYRNNDKNQQSKYQLKHLLLHTKMPHASRTMDRSPIRGSPPCIKMIFGLLLPERH